MFKQKRKGDENIGKLIIFSLTIILAVSLVAIIHNIYRKSEINTINMGLLVSVKSKWEDLQHIQTQDGFKIGDDSGCGCNIDGSDTGRVIFSPVDNTFFMTGITATDNSDRCLNCFSKIRGIDLVSNTDDSIEYVVK